jgi:hypothetical protein
MFNSTKINYNDNRKFIFMIFFPHLFMVSTSIIFIISRRYKHKYLLYKIDYCNLGISN